MSNTIKVTVVEGAEKGSEFTLDLSKPLMVGRSHSADIRLSEADVSGKHFEFVQDASDVVVKVLSRNGLLVDGKLIGEGKTAPVRGGTRLRVGGKVKLVVDVFPTPSGSADAVQQAPLDQEAAKPPAPAESAIPPTPDEPLIPSAPAESDLPPLQDQLGFADEETATNMEDSETFAGDGETQEMKTRIGSFEEIAERKRQLERSSRNTRWRIGVMLSVFIAFLAGIWYFLGWRSQAIDIDGPYQKDGKTFDNANTFLLNNEGKKEFVLVYPRNDAMTVYVSPDSNTVKVATWFGTKSDVPFFLEFTRWSDRADMMRSLEESFERWMIDETAKGSVFETQGGQRPKGEFFEDEYPGGLAFETLRGTRFVRAGYTRTRDMELWRGVGIYFRKGDTIHLLRLEVPDMFWRLAKRRVAKEPHMFIYGVFLGDHWDSPGLAGIVDRKFSDDDLLLRIKRELSAERVSAWPDLASYIDTLLVRSWGDQPRLQQEALSYYLAMQDRMYSFYHEREFAYQTARANRNEKRIRAIVADCKAAFSVLPRDRRSALVNNPEVWSCQLR